MKVPRFLSPATNEWLAAWFELLETAESQERVRVVITRRIYRTAPDKQSSPDRSQGH
jgi:hypothetical protein